MILPDPLGGGSTGEMPRNALSLSLVAPCASAWFAYVWLAYWNGPSAQFDNEHGPLVVVQPTDPRDLIVRKVTDSKTVASDGAGGQRKRLPGMSDVVQTISICPVPILPRLAPRNTGQDKHDWRGAADQLQLKTAQRTLLGHVRRGTVMI